VSVATSRGVSILLTARFRKTVRLVSGQIDGVLSGFEERERSTLEAHLSDGRSEGLLQLRVAELVQDTAPATSAEVPRAGTRDP
jgi:hypothetical protein